MKIEPYSIYKKPDGTFVRVDINASPPPDDWELDVHICIEEPRKAATILPFPQQEE